jgi:hypothetical protein
MNTKKIIGQSLVLLLFLLATATSIWLGTKLIDNSIRVKKYKKDLFMANQIKDGFLNGQNWSRQVERIIEHKIDSFSLSRRNKTVLKRQVSGIMYKLLEQVDETIHEKQDNLKDKVKMGVVRAIVDLDKVRADVPKYADIVVAEIDKTKNRDQVKELVKEKVNELLIGDSSILRTDQQIILSRYHEKNLQSFNRKIERKTTAIEDVQKVLGYELIAVMGFVLLLWLLLIKMNFHHAFALAFTFSVIISFVNLYTGINLPMLEIDARIAHMDLEVMHSHIVFFDQILFYQSKSIWDVASILIMNGKIDSIFVGCLVLLFSVFFPVFKLISACVYLFRKRKKESGFVYVMAFKSGKWSMADVMVVAIFISYIGFQSILTNQLGQINSRANEVDMVNLMATNKSNLQIGFLIFVSFVLFNLFLSAILKRITKSEAPTSGARMFRDTYAALRERRAQRHGPRPPDRSEANTDRANGA